MIENEELGVKITTDPMEALFTKVKKEAEYLIQQSEDNLIIQKAMLEMAESKLKVYEKEVDTL
jgi:hypothetical protein